MNRFRDMTTTTEPRGRNRRSPSRTSYSKVGAGTRRVEGDCFPDAFALPAGHERRPASSGRRAQHLRSGLLHLCAAQLELPRNAPSRHSTVDIRDRVLC